MHELAAGGVGMRRWLARCRGCAQCCRGDVALLPQWWHPFWFTGGTLIAHRWHDDAAMRVHHCHASARQGSPDMVMTAQCCCEGITPLEGVLAPRGD